MRRVLVVVTSVATGLLSVLVAVVALALALRLYAGRMAVGPNEAVGFDVVSLLGPHWKVFASAIPLAIFGLGLCVGFLFLRRRLLGDGSHRA